MSSGKVKCAICRFQPGEKPQVRNAEYIWEGVSVCDRHLIERRALLLQQSQQREIARAKPSIDVPEIFQPKGGKVP